VDVAFRYDEIGKRLKAFRLGSGLSADEIARRIGISRTALYRFERGELAKIGTLESLAELLDVSIPTLLGVGIEFIASAVAYFERLRQIEEEAEHISVLAGPLSYLLASDSFDKVLEQLLVESIPHDLPNHERLQADVRTILDILQQRKVSYRKRSPAVVNLLSGIEIERLLRNGFVAKAELPAEEQARRIALARAEIEHISDLTRRPPIGVQIGVVRDALPQTGFQIFRSSTRKIMTLSPFRLGENTNIRVGVAMVTSAAEALILHERAVKEMWDTALKGGEAGDYLDQLLASSRPYANVRRFGDQVTPGRRDRGLLSN
jgi:transcriptional regulator with XRE-family HTH domain